MVATNDKVQFDFNADFGDSNYKSCFARSVVVNSQFHTKCSKSLDIRQLQKFNKGNNEADDVFKLKKEVPVPPPSVSEDPPSLLRRMSTSSSSGVSASTPTPGARPGTPGGFPGTPGSFLGTPGGLSGLATPRLVRRGSDLPVEQLQLQTAVDTLQWQLKQAEASRQMYRAVLQQVASFLERAHRSLSNIGEQRHSTSAGVQRSRSEFHVAHTPEEKSTSNGGQDQSPHDFRDFSWRRPQRKQTSPDEIPPEKLSQEAFRLLRTAQSLLHTREPDLAHVTAELSPKDQEFLSQLAREFPSRPQRATSFSVNPQLISPSDRDRDIRISTAFNRKLSLQRTPDLRKKTEVVRNLENDYCLMNSITSNDDDKRSSVISVGKKSAEKAFFDSVLDKPPSPKTGSVSSAEDESGFSSMNSFQEVGLPIVNSTVIDNDLFKNGDISVNSSDSNITQIDVLNDKSIDKSKLIWNRPEIGLPINHRRWSSTPVEVAQNDALKVLWV